MSGSSQPRSRPPASSSMWRASARGRQKSIIILMLAPASTLPLIHFTASPLPPEAEVDNVGEKATGALLICHCTMFLPPPPFSVHYILMVYPILLQLLGFLLALNVGAS